MGLTSVAYTGGAVSTDRSCAHEDANSTEIRADAMARHLAIERPERPTRCIAFTIRRARPRRAPKLLRANECRGRQALDRNVGIKDELLRVLRIVHAEGSTTRDNDVVVDRAGLIR